LKRRQGEIAARLQASNTPRRNAPRNCSAEGRNVFASGMAASRRGSQLSVGPWCSSACAAMPGAILSCSRRRSAVPRGATLHARFRGRARTRGRASSEQRDACAGSQPPGKLDCETPPSGTYWPVAMRVGWEVWSLSALVSRRPWAVGERLYERRQRQCHGCTRCQGWRTGRHSRPVPAESNGRGAPA
jgi:hypothetical protein